MSGEACNLCGAGCWSNESNCEHDCIDRRYNESIKKSTSKVDMIESPSKIEPCMIGENAETSNLISELIEKSATLNTALHPSTAESLSSIIRILDCYHSNRIEGHTLKLEDIERVLNNEFDDDIRELQIEALAHINVQRKIDDLYADGKISNPASIKFISWLHKEFYSGATDALKIGDIVMEPGQFRSTEDVSVGRHIPPSGSNVDRFMRYFEQRYNFERMSNSNQIIAIAAAHHRLAYIHPFLDGNGRVGRLMSYAMFLQAGLGNLWSISRGLGLNDYKGMMDLADMPRQGDLDGRGNLSQKALIRFINWFLRVSIGQVESSLSDIENLRDRLEEYVCGLRSDTTKLSNILNMLHGEVKYSEEMNCLIEDGILSESKGLVSLQFNVSSARILFPKLFEDTLPDPIENQGLR